MAKKRKAPPSREITTKRRLARWQRERRRRRFIIFLGALVIAVVIGIIAFGAYRHWIALPREGLSTVHGTIATVKFTRADYLDMLRAYPQGTPETPLIMLEHHELMRQGAEEFGVDVTDDDITEEIKSILFPDDEEVSEEEFQERYQQELELQGISDEHYRWFVGYDLLQGRLDEYLGEQVPEEMLQVHVLGILVATDEVAQTVIERLEGGEDFASLAAEEFNLDSVSKENGGDLGWIPEGLKGTAFDGVAFNLELDEVSPPFITGSGQGYWVIKVLEREENRALSEETRERLQAMALGNWLAAEREEKVERKSNLDLDEVYEWAIGRID
ncbi:MAG: peptidylprolyl isomerase [Chloroflexi bacterium]|nr:peptidylprolyl isomerase [Chloroflexota bacterium]